MFSYVVARDYGFAPNPFFGVCTLATCKPRIRKSASVGDWVIGTGSRKNGRQGHLVFAMCVTETMTFNQYWKSKRFRRKRPNLQGSMKQAFGDNIYFKDEQGQWQQKNSHHSIKDGSPNLHNIRHDTQTDRILIGSDYSYWGGSGPKIPGRFRNYNGKDICAIRNHKNKFSDQMVREFIDWYRKIGIKGFQYKPSDW